MAWAIRIEEAELEADHPLLAVRYHNMAGIEAAAKNFIAALEWENKANPIFRQHFDSNHNYVTISDNALVIYKNLLKKHSVDTEKLPADS